VSKEDAAYSIHSYDVGVIGVIEFSTPKTELLQIDLNKQTS
jgi:hypothetical protein